MSENTPYSGSGMVYVGNDAGLHIIHTGQSSLLTLSRPLHMRSLLFVPNITKNLIYVSKFAKDYQVLFEFFPNNCQVRDLRTKEMLLQGFLHDGLYRLNLPPTSKPLTNKLAQCFTVARVVPLDV